MLSFHKLGIIQQSRLQKKQETRLLVLEILVGQAFFLVVSFEKTWGGTIYGLGWFSGVHGATRASDSADRLHVAIGDLKGYWNPVVWWRYQLVVCLKKYVKRQQVFPLLSDTKIPRRSLLSLGNLELRWLVLRTMTRWFSTLFYCSLLFWKIWTDLLYNSS